MPELNEAQIKQYNTFRAEGMTPERALMLATQDGDNKYNPVLEAGVDNVLFGKGSFAESLLKGAGQALGGGFKRVYDDTSKYGAGFALLKSPLSLAAGAGEGVGTVIGGALETLDDVTGETASEFFKPYVEGAVNSDVGQYLMKQAIELDTKGRGIPGDILDTLNLVGLGAFVKSGAASTIKNRVVSAAKDVLERPASVADDLGRPAAGSTLSDFMPKGSFMDNAVDSIVESGVRALDKVREIPTAVAESARRTIDRRILRIVEENPTKAADDILELYKRGVVPGVKKKNKTIANVQGIDEAVKRAVPDLAKKYDVEDLEDFALAIGAEKKKIFSDIEKGLVEAGEQGRAIDFSETVKQLDELANSERAEFSKPLRDAIARAKRELVDEAEDGTITPKNISPSGAQDLIADLNSQLQAYYRGTTPGTNADVIVDTLVVNNLRKSVDDVVEDLGEGSFKELKSRYADLKKMEDDVVHRAVFEAQKGGGLADLTDILSAGDIAAGAINPLFLAKGAAQFLTKEVIKSLSNKDEMIRQMFLYGKNLP